MPDYHYVDPKLVALYDLDSAWSKDRDFYLSLAERGKKNILDLGCGTGLIANAYAEYGHRVTGVDPAPEMLESARKKSCGARIDWVESSAQNFVSQKRFDLIIMTGHAFQVLLEDSEIDSTFRSMKKHLAEEGFIVFESRNPQIDWTQKWNYDVILKTEDGPVRESRRLLNMKNDRMIFELIYEFPDETLVSKSELRFLSHEDIAIRLSDAGLKLVETFGYWDKSAFNTDLSEEMIFVVKK